MLSTVSSAHIGGRRHSVILSVPRLRINGLWLATNLVTAQSVEQPPEATREASCRDIVARSRLPAVPAAPHRSDTEYLDLGLRVHWRNHRLSRWCSAQSILYSAVSTSHIDPMHARFYQRFPIGSTAARSPLWLGAMAAGCAAGLLGPCTAASAAPATGGGAGPPLGAAAAPAPAWAGAFKGCCWFAFALGARANGRPKMLRAPPAGAAGCAAAAGAAGAAAAASLLPSPFFNKIFAISGFFSISSRRVLSSAAVTSSLCRFLTSSKRAQFPSLPPLDGSLKCV